MSLVRMLRTLWLPGLTSVTGHVKSGLREWIGECGYQLSHAAQPSRFALDISAFQPLLNGFAGDINRMAAAAFETALGLKKHPVFPRSSSWLVVETYYASFFAAHALMRMFGTSITQFDSPEASSIDAVATMYGVAARKKTTQGAYECVFDTQKSQLKCELLTQTGGVHQVFWGKFGSTLARLSNDVLNIKTETSINKQTVSERLLKLLDNLRYGPYSNSSWLSHVRNAVNYRHDLGCWYPFQYEKSRYRNLHDQARRWLDDPLKIDLTVTDKNDLEGFQNTCQYVIALCRELTEEFGSRSTGKSFATFRPLSAEPSRSVNKNILKDIRFRLSRTVFERF